MMLDTSAFSKVPEYKNEKGSTCSQVNNNQSRASTNGSEKLLETVGDRCQRPYQSMATKSIGSVKFKSREELPYSKAVQPSGEVILSSMRNIRESVILSSRVCHKPGGDSDETYASAAKRVFYKPASAEVVGEDQNNSHTATLENEDSDEISISETEIEPEEPSISLIRIDQLRRIPPSGLRFRDLSKIMMVKVYGAR